MKLSECVTCGSEITLFYDVVSTDEAQGIWEGNVYRVVEWKDTGDTEVRDEYWMCRNGHVAHPVGVEVVE